MPKRTNKSPITLALLILPRDRALITPPPPTRTSLPRASNLFVWPRTTNRPLPFNLPLTSARVHLLTNAQYYLLTSDGQAALQYLQLANLYS
jgi:hypothetical protein